MKQDGKYQAPPNCILVARGNWDAYFYPYAARAYLFAGLLKGWYTGIRGID